MIYTLLQMIWARSIGEWVFMPEKTAGGNWRENPIRLPEPGSSSTIILPGENHDHYFSPLVFTQPRRRNENAGAPGVLFADLDSVNPNTIQKNIKPSIAWETSPDSYQAVWLLNRPMSDIDEWRTLNRSLTYDLGADKGGWMQNKVLRVPETHNHKYREAPRGRVLWSLPHLAYDAEVIRHNISRTITAPLDIKLPPVPNKLPGHEDAQAILKSRWHDLPLSAQYWLTISAEQYERRSKLDRSLMIWDMAQALHKNGFTPEEIWAVIFNTPWCKWREAPYRLWAEVNKAIAKAD